MAAKEELYKPGPRTWEVLAKQYAYFGGDHGCPHLIVCIAESIAKFIKGKEFQIAFEENLRFLQYCSSQRSSTEETYVLLKAKTLNKTQVEYVLELVAGVFGEKCHFILLLKDSVIPTSPINIHRISKAGEFKGLVDRKYISREYDGKMAYSVSQHKEWISQRKQLEVVFHESKEITEKVKALLVKLEPCSDDLSAKAFKALQTDQSQIRKEMMKKFKEMSTKIDKVIKAIPKSLSVLSDGWTITQMASNCNKSLEDSKMAFTSKWQRYKMWMDWKAASFSFVAQLNKIKENFEEKVTFFSNSDEEFLKLSMLKSSLQKYRGFLKGIREFVTIPYTDELEICLSCVKHEMLQFIGTIPKDQESSRDFAEKTSSLLKEELSKFEEFSFETTDKCSEKLSLIERSFAIHRFMRECDLWCEGSTAVLAEACVYGGQDKSKKSELIQDLMRTYRKRPKLNNDALRGNPRLLNIFTPVVQEVSLKVEEASTRLEKQLKAWGYSPESTDGAGMEHVYDELLDGEEKYVEVLSVVFKDYYPAIRERGSDVPVRISEGVNELFGNVEEIFEIHSELLPKLRAAGCNPRLIREIFGEFAKRMEVGYSDYCRHYNNHQDIINGDSQAEQEFYRKMKIELHQVQPLSAMLATPCKRLMVYRQLLCNMVPKATNKAGKDEIAIAINLMDNVIKAVDIQVKQKHGNTKLDEIMKVKIPTKGLKLSAFKERHVVLYERALSIYKIAAETSLKRTFDQSEEEKAVILVSEMAVPQAVQGSSLQFSITLNLHAGKKDKKDYIFETTSEKNRNDWVEQLRKLLQEELLRCRETVPRLHSSQVLHQKSHLAFGVSSLGGYDDGRFTSSLPTSTSLPHQLSVNSAVSEDTTKVNSNGTSPEPSSSPDQDETSVAEEQTYKVLKKHQKDGMELKSGEEVVVVERKNKKCRVKSISRKVELWIPQNHLKLTK